MRPAGRKGNDAGVSPVIGVMLMIVVTLIIAAIVSAFAGGFTSGVKKASTSVLSCTVLYGTGSGSFPNGGLLFTQKSGDPIVLNSTYLVLANGVATQQFTNMTLVQTNNASWIIRSGSQFVLPADISCSAAGSNCVSGGYLGWNSGFTLTTSAISTYKLVDSPTGQTIAEGKIDV